MRPPFVEPSVPVFVMCVSPNTIVVRVVVGERVATTRTAVRAGTDPLVAGFEATVVPGRPVEPTIRTGSGEAGRSRISPPVSGLDQFVVPVLAGRDGTEVFGVQERTELSEIGVNTTACRVQFLYGLLFDRPTGAFVVLDGEAHAIVPFDGHRVVGPYVEVLERALQAVAFLGQHELVVVWHVTPEELAPVRRDEGDASVPGLGEGRPDDVSDPLIGERRRDERECDVARDRLGVRFDAAELPDGQFCRDERRDLRPEVTAGEEAHVRAEGRCLMRLDTDAEPVAAIREAIDAQEQVTVELRNYRKSGEPFWNRVSIAPVYDETGQLRNYVGFQEDITDRKERIEKLRQYETIVETTGDTTAVLDENGRFELVNGRLADIYDATPEELQGEQARLVTYLREQHSGVYEDLVDGRRESFRTELELTYPTHGTRHADIRMTRLASDGEFRGIVVVGRDISDRKQYERSLSALYEAITEFVGAATRPEAVEHVVSAMSDAADLPNAAVYLYDEDEGVLRPERLSPDGADLVGTPPTIGPGEGVAWRVFAAGETVLYDDVREAEDVYNPETPVRSELIVPLGEHGVLIAGDPRPGAFDERNREFAEIIAAAAEATLDSVAQTERLRERTRELDRQMTRLDRVNDLNGAIRRINRAVVDADSREAIVETVCDRLVDLGTIEFAWVGEPAPDAGQLSLGAWAGADRSYLDMREFPIDGTDSADPSLATARSQDVTYVPDIVRRAQAGEWQTAALQQGYKSVLSVPLAYDDSLYGVLTVFAPRQDLFDDAFRTILTELGELVGLGLNALDRRDALLGRRHTTVELEFDSGDTDDPLFSLTQALDCTVEISTILPRDDASLVYAECTAVTEQQVQTTVTDLPGIREVRRVRGTDPCESEPCLFEFLVTDAGFLSDLARHGVRSQTVTFEGDRSRIVAVVPSTVDPGTLVDDLRARWPGLELAGRGIEHEAATASSAFLLTSELTAAQQEAVEAAYEAGFFEWPRDSTSEDIAAALGISQPAFAQRLRAAESKLFDAYCRGVRRQSAGRLRS